MSALFKRHTVSKSNVILLSHEGNISFDLIHSFLDKVERELDSTSLAIKSRRKLMNVLIEVLQNLSFNAQKANFKVWVEGGCCFVATGNLLETEKVESLKKWLESINQMSDDEVKIKHKEILVNGMFGDYGGAGLGFLDIRKKSGSRFQISFDKVDEQNSYFNFETKIELVHES